MTAKGYRTRRRRSDYVEGSRRAYEVRRLAERRAMLNAIKMERGCERCGYRGHPAALDFDHINPHTKTANVGSMALGMSLSRIAAEVEQCRVLCANCHRIATFEAGCEKRKVKRERRVQQRLPGF